MNNLSVIISKMTIQQRSDGRYEGRITINGNRKSFYGKKKAEIKNKAKKYLEKIENGYQEPRNIIFNDYIEYWLKTYKHNKIEPTSYSRLYSVYIHQIHDTIGTKKIGEITTKDIQHLIDAHANPQNSSVKPLALSGLKRILHFLNPCLEKAVEEHIIQKNPCAYVTLPKESCIQTATKQQFSLSDEELEEFRRQALSRYKTTKEYRSRDALVLLIMVNLGLRAGEMLALEWTDIDMANGIVHITKTVQESITDYESKNEEKKTYKRIKPSTKTPTGVRVLPLNKTVQYYVQELKSYDNRNHIDSVYVSCTKVGTMQNARNLQRSLDRLISRTTINRDVSLHTLRHTFGSTLLRNGVNIEVVSKLMGHSNITITYNKYIHVIQEEKAKAMKGVSIC